MTQMRLCMILCSPSQQSTIPPDTTRSNTSHVPGLILFEIFNSRDPVAGRDHTNINCHTKVHSPIGVTTLVHNLSSRHFQIKVSFHNSPVITIRILYQKMGFWKYLLHIFFTVFVNSPQPPPPPSSPSPLNL